MKKIIKSYYPMIISILLIYIMGFLFKTISLNTNDFNNSSWAIFFLGIEIILVAAVWAEIIGFIIHAAQNKELKNRILWIIAIYSLNVFIIPYYNLKYVIKENKIVTPTIVFGILMVTSFVLGLIIA